MSPKQYVSFCSHGASIVLFMMQVNGDSQIVWKSQGNRQSAVAPAMDGSSPL